MSYQVKIISLLLLLFSFHIIGEEASASLSEKKLLIGLEQRIKNAVHEIIMLEIEAGRSPEEINYIYPIKSKSIINLGLLLDLSKFQSNTFYKILSVTKGGVAENIGLRPDDRIKSVNNIIISRDNYLEAYELLSTYGGGELVLSIDRLGTKIEVSSKVKHYSIPPATLVIGSAEQLNSPVKETEILSLGCSTLSTEMTPKEPRGIKKVSVTAINGKPVSAKKELLDLPVGNYSISVSHFESTPKFLIFRDVRKRSKTINLNLEKDVRFHLGALLLKGKVNSQNENDYWQPVVWQVTKDFSARCRKPSGLLDSSIDHLEKLADTIRTALYELAVLRNKFPPDVGRQRLLISIPVEKKIDLGIIVSLQQPKQANGLKVLSVSPNSLSEKLGIKAGDIILMINGIDISKMSARDAYTALINQLSNQSLMLEVKNTSGILRTIETQLNELKLPAIKLFSTT